MHCTTEEDRVTETAQGRALKGRDAVLHYIIAVIAF